MNIEFDRTGFPLISLDSIRAHLHVWPVTKLQYERYISDPWGGLTDVPAYHAICQENPRAPLKESGSTDRWRFLCTGLRAEEIMRFSAWEGSNYRLPTLDEWRLASESLAEMRADVLVDGILAASKADPMIKRLLAILRNVPSTSDAMELCMFSGTVMEWVSGPDSLTAMLIGKANPKLWNLIETRGKYEPLVPRSNRRLKYAGFRLLRMAG